MECREKRIFHTRKEAKRICKIVSREERIKLRVYRCLDCGKFHLTSWTAAEFAAFIRNKNKNKG